MKYRVIQWATGHVGKHALRGAAQRPDMELVGLYVSSPDKEGRDAGELCGIGPIGVKATRDGAALLKMEADCVSYAAATDYRLGDALDRWPLAPEEMHDIATELRWWWWDAGCRRVRSRLPPASCSPCCHG